MSGNEGAECMKNAAKQVFSSIKSQLIYLKANENDNEYICMGISALDIREALGDRLEHIMLIKSEYLGDDCINNFEILSDAKHVDEVLSGYRFGDLCFTDYADKTRINKLTDNEIAELLFIGHMHRPINRPFIDTLGNKIIYIGHDNAFWCKLYCSFDIFCEIVKATINSHTGKNLLLDISKKYLSIGILVDMKECNGAGVPFYSIGAYSNMDEIINDFSNIKKQCAMQRLRSVI